MPRFTEEVEAYHVLVLHLGDYVRSTRELPDGFRFLEQAQVQSFRQQEKAMLRQTFDDWHIPYGRKLRGWRQDSAIFMVHGDRLAGGVYLCDKNEFDDERDRGQVHYAFMDPRFQGMGIYSLIFREGVVRARAWGLAALYLNSDRYLLPEVYMRWGAKSWEVIPKRSRLPRTAWANVLRAAYSRWRGLRRRVRRI